jgi:hypothetical protein
MITMHAFAPIPALPPDRGKESIFATSRRGMRAAFDALIQQAPALPGLI